MNQTEQVINSLETFKVMISRFHDSPEGTDAIYTEICLKDDAVCANKEGDCNTCLIGTEGNEVEAIDHVIKQLKLINLLEK